jgi:Fe-Mn family superoxide dismutase
LRETSPLANSRHSHISGYNGRPEVDTSRHPRPSTCGSGALRISNDTGKDQIVTIYTLPSLDYDYKDLEPHLSAEILELHHSKHHAAYVDGANATLNNLADAREAGDFGTLNKLEKDLAFHLSGHVLHSMLWKNLSPNGGGEPGGKLGSAIDESFSSFDAMKKQLSAAAMGIQGSGWACLAWDPLSESLIVQQVYDHQGNVGSATIPLLALDMWEHAFYLQYRNVKAKWVEAFWQLVNWEDVEKRLAGARKTDLVLD